MSNIISKINKNRLLAISIGIIYLWFGALKFFPELSPADGLAKQTISLLTFEIIPEKISIILLALIEVCIGTLLIFNYQLKKVIIAALIHLSMTFIPILLFPDTSFEAPFVLTLVGQYIIKNIVIISALLFIYPIDHYKKIPSHG